LSCSLPPARRSRPVTSESSSICSAARKASIPKNSARRYWIGVNEDLYLFPTFTQNYTWTKEPVSRDDKDESITFQTDQGLSVNADVGISYEVDPSKVTTFSRSIARASKRSRTSTCAIWFEDALVTEASTRQIEMVYGSGKAELLAAVEKRVRAQVNRWGSRSSACIGLAKFRLPATVTNAIDAKIKATQLPSSVVNEVAAAKAKRTRPSRSARRR